MKKISGSTLWFTLIVSGVLAAAPVAATVVEKSILVTVLDKEGAPIKDLAAAEFSVTEDGARREVT
ncbi:MAG: hypothetical protein ABIP90_09025, partial [Vicinamibacterales bacterium]